MEYEWSRLTDSLNTANPETIAQYVKTELEIRIENALGIGKENALKMKDLKQKLGLKTDRTIRSTMERMKRRTEKPCLILSSTEDGYWIAKNFEEVEIWANLMVSYIADISHTVKCVVTAAENKYHRQYQLPLFL